MTVNLFKESTAAARRLGHDLRGVLADLDPAVARPLLDRLSVEAHSTPLLVFTGYHSSGKSTLIEALTDRRFNIPIGSGVTTDAVAEYDWDGDVRLVDTPGVHAGRPQHDERAEQALQAADLVLFAVPVELFDDTLVAHLRDVLGRLGKSRQTIIVITKAGTMDAAPGHREAAIQQALGPFDPVPWVECDAHYYLDGLDLAHTAPADATAFIEASGLSRVAATINSFAAEQGHMGRLAQPLQLLLALALEASAYLTDDPDEQAALAVLARQRSALSKKRVHLDSLLEARAAQFRADAVRAAAVFADGVEREEQGGDLSDSALEVLVGSLNAGLGAAFERFESAVRQVLEVQFDDLASEVLEIEASPYGRVALHIGAVEPTGFDGREVAVVPGRAPSTPAPSWAGDLTTYLEKFNTFWGAGNGIKAASGSNGHAVVLKVGHAFGKKFKPWEAVKTANNIGRAAKVGGAVIAIGVEAYTIVADERAAVQAERARAERRRNLSQEVLAQADGIVASALSAVRKNLDDVFKPEFQRIDVVARSIHGARAARSELRERLSSVQQGASEAVAAFSPRRE
ncbi:50S ribosome-binding GTPase [Modestobacter sp. VKM Ac-2979]|uniref:GTPase domain-containing protein n=1 Tax=unclassified Modestobacter TaxID=2643866 RepID=UPI0022ABC2BC|nr:MULTISPECIES: GTPase [unclassified Modestobacter]MCZ2811804.1 50S ribosome-binding GTPase [Modestobacter sp. VKM Ac-2979]MCZ2843527.1 50S ribosome-binding GTPase [Modestobacter sp. VKM Ac-2980]